jgi:nicotinamidase-related amidase
MYSEEEILRLARRAYETGDAGFEVKADRCALLVIDMQDEFVRPGWTTSWVPEATRRVPAIATLIKAARDHRVPVIYTIFDNTHLGLDRPAPGSLMPNRYAHIRDPGEATWFVNSRVWHELEPAAGDVVIRKPSYGAFYDTPLDTILRNLRRDTIIICGTLTNYCCGTTARQGYERGYFVVFGSDVTATDDPAQHEAELRVLRKGFARVLTASEIIRAVHGSGRVQGA